MRVASTLVSRQMMSGCKRRGQVHPVDSVQTPAKYPYKAQFRGTGCPRETYIPQWVVDCDVNASNTSMSLRWKLDRRRCAGYIEVGGAMASLTDSDGGTVQAIIFRAAALMVACARALPQALEYSFVPIVLLDLMRDLARMGRTESWLNSRRT
jgi:hypothetical protein